MRRTFQPMVVGSLIEVLQNVDTVLVKKKRSLRVTVLGGASLLLLGLRERTTVDIDIAITPDAEAFRRLCADMNIPVDMVSVASTVDLVHCPVVEAFRGKALLVDSVTPADLIRLKLERFRKQDPDDIAAIIEHERMDFISFAEVVEDMLPVYIGNVREVILSAQIIVERIYPEQSDSFRRRMKKTHP